MSLASAIAPLTPIFMEHFPYLHLTADEAVEMMRPSLEARLKFKLPSEAHEPTLEISPEGGLLIWFDIQQRKPAKKASVNTRPPA